MGRSGKTVECVIGYNGWSQKKFKGWCEDFLRFVEYAADELSGGLPFPLGYTPFVPTKVFPPFARSGQRILADVSHLIARAVYSKSVFVAMPVVVGYLTANSCLKTCFLNAVFRWIDSRF